MKNQKLRFTAPVCVAGLALLLSFLSIPGTEAKSYAKKIYVIEVQKHYLHWSSGSESYAWVSLHETTSKEDAESIYQFLHWAFLNGYLDYLNSVDGVVITTVVDIRLRIRYENQTIPTAGRYDAGVSGTQLGRVRP